MILTSPAMVPLAHTVDATQSPLIRLGAIRELATDTTWSFAIAFVPIHVHRLAQLPRPDAVHSPTDGFRVARASTGVCGRRWT